MFLGVHGSFFDLDSKRGRMSASGPNPFIDPEGYRNFIAGAEQRFLAQLSFER